MAAIQKSRSSKLLLRILTIGLTSFATFFIHDPAHAQLFFQARDALSCVVGFSSGGTIGPLLALLPDIILIAINLFIFGYGVSVLVTVYQTRQAGENVGAVIQNPLILFVTIAILQVFAILLFSGFTCNIGTGG